MKQSTNKISLLATALALLVTGCSDLATRDAPIEDRSGAAAGVATTGAGSSGSGGSAGAGGTVAGAAGTAGAGGAVGTGAEPAEGVKTHGTSSPGVEVHALPGAADGVSGPGAAGGAITAGSIAAGPEQYVNMRTPPQDPTSPLAKRAIYFDYDSSTIKDDFRELIKAHAEFLKASKEAKSILQGHTDERGSRDYNLALGQRRAESVQQALVLLGVDAMKLESVSLGEEKPAKEGFDEAAWSLNRRVEIYYQGE
jgi:peptidoglycan-associated lipoprotein